MSRDTKTVRRTSWGLDTSDRYFDQFWDHSVHTLMNLENIVFNLTSRDTKTVRHISWEFYHGYFDQEQFETNQKSSGSNVIWLKLGFSWFWDIALDIWPMFYCVSHALGMKYWHRHAKFHNNRSSIKWVICPGHTHKHKPHTRR